MTFRISRKRASIAGVTATALQPTASATTWWRLEALPTSDDIAESLAAPLADPLWMLGRQWQFNELTGEDAATPIGTSLSIDGIPLASLTPLGKAGARVPLGLDTPPLEALVEREQALCAHPKLNAQAGQQLLRSLRAAGRDGAATRLLDDFPATIAAPHDAVADNAGFAWSRLLDKKAIDAHALAAELKPVVTQTAALDAFVAKRLGAPDTVVTEQLRRWYRWLSELVSEGEPKAGHSPYWNPGRLEYGFALEPAAASSLRLEAQEYLDGKLDWDDFVAKTEGPQPVLPTPAAIELRGQQRMPTLARYAGMPADRYWECEDGRVNFGLVSAAKTDLTRLAVLDYALTGANDWFLIPVTLPLNGVYRVSSLEVRDNFGGTTKIPPARRASTSRWSLHELATDVPAARDLLYLCPASETLEGPPLEQVLFVRDEMANVVWGIEERVQGTSGESIDRRLESQRLSGSQTMGAGYGGLDMHYRLQTPVAPHWIPFLPVRRAGATPNEWSIQLERGVVVHHHTTDIPGGDPRLALVARLDNATFVESDAGPHATIRRFKFHPRGTVLRAEPSLGVAGLFRDILRIEDQEVPREGAQVQRAFNYTRDARGRAVLWIGRSKRVGRGEGASGLEFDVIDR